MEADGNNGYTPATASSTSASFVQTVHHSKMVFELQ
jgi:hypothetical protein